MDGWNTTFLLGRPIFKGYVSFREGIFWEDDSLSQALVLIQDMGTLELWDVRFCVES